MHALRSAQGTIAYIGYKSFARRRHCSQGCNRAGINLGTTAYASNIGEVGKSNTSFPCCDIGAHRRSLIYPVTYGLYRQAIVRLNTP